MVRVVFKAWQHENENNGCSTFAKWYEEVLENSDDFELCEPGAGNIDLVLSVSDVLYDTDKAKEVLDLLKDNPEAKMIILCGQRYQQINSVKKRCLNILDRADAILHNSVFTENAQTRIKNNGQIFRRVDLNMFVPTDSKPLALKERNFVVATFGELLKLKGTHDLIRNFKRYGNSRYLYSSFGNYKYLFQKTKETNTLGKFESHVALDINKFNMVDGYEHDDEDYWDFLRHVRFAVFCHGTATGYDSSAWQEAPEYCVLEAIDAGVPIIVHEDWLNSITVFGEKPDIENSGILTYREWSDLGKENLMRWEKDYDEIVKKQKAFLAKWWGVSAIEKLLAIFREIVGEPELDPEMLLDGDEE